LPEKNHNPVVIGKKKSLPPNAANYTPRLTLFFFAPPKVHTKNPQVRCLLHEKKNTSSQFVPEVLVVVPWFDVRKCCHPARLC
jgi:hypothetical protein